ncbi:MAG: FAD-binding oxidoreductase [Deltaproteobacteria bacterium]|nr:FAD-binding oxidoreductase [Deltaproteobacteria bacterium]
MDLKSGYPFWSVKNGLLQAFPATYEDLRCDVAVVGAGITGALIADELSQHGHDVVVIEERDVGWGSSAASTALLQYEIDTHLVDLARLYGERDAVLAYQACAAAIPRLEALAAEVRDVDFRTMHSLYYASRARHTVALQDEYALRAKHGFAVEWLDRGPLHERYRIAAPGAILSTLAACIDPYRMAYRLLARVAKSGGRVFDRTAVARLDATSRGVVLHTSHGGTVRAKHVVLAAGYGNARWLKQRVAKNRSTYAVITEPVADVALGALERTMVWESARPYLYMRTTGDRRLLIGGEDDATDLPARRDARVLKKAGRLIEQVATLFPRLPLEFGFAWAGTFAETRDGLPYFGAHAEHGSRVHFAMAYGGNGITYSMIGAGLLRATIERRTHPLAELFSFRRLER